MFSGLYAASIDDMCRLTRHLIEHLSLNPDTYTAPASWHTRRFQTHRQRQEGFQALRHTLRGPWGLGAMRCLLLAFLNLQEGRPPKDVLMDRMPAVFSDRHGFASTSPKAVSRMLGGAFGDGLFWRRDASESSGCRRQVLSGRQEPLAESPPGCVHQRLRRSRQQLVLARPHSATELSNELCRTAVAVLLQSCGSASARAAR